MLFVTPPDFRVRYVFRTPEEGGRKVGPPSQGFRCDFLYKDQEPGKNPVYYVWPEFEDESGHTLPEGALVPMRGTALMRVIQDSLRPYHRSRIHSGTCAFLLEANRIVADLEVTDVLALASGA
jgi:hypothetical protein